MSAPFQTIPLLHLDLTSEQGRRVLQDAFDQIVAMFAAGRITTDHLSPELVSEIDRATATVQVTRVAAQSTATNVPENVEWDRTDYNDDPSNFIVASDHIVIRRAGRSPAPADAVLKNTSGSTPLNAMGSVGAFTGPRSAPTKQVIAFTAPAAR